MQLPCGDCEQNCNTRAGPTVVVVGPVVSVHLEPNFSCVSCNTLGLLGLEKQTDTAAAAARAMTMLNVVIEFCNDKLLFWK
jgi:hypothetical protein